MPTSEHFLNNKRQPLKGVAFAITSENHFFAFLAAHIALAAAAIFALASGLMIRFTFTDLVAGLAATVGLAAVFGAVFGAVLAALIFAQRSF